METMKGPPAPKMPVISGRVEARSRATLTIIQGGRPAVFADHWRCGRVVKAGVASRRLNDDGPPSLPPGRRAAW